MLRPLEVLAASPDNNQVTADTLALMVPWSHWAAGHEPVWRATAEALARARVGLEAPRSAKAAAVHSWITRRGWRCLINWLTGESQCLTFVPHEQLLQQLGFSGEEQLLVPPYLFLAFGSGDCPMFAMLTGAMLECAGVPWVFTTLAADARAAVSRSGDSDALGQLLCSLWRVAAACY